MRKLLILCGLASVLVSGCKGHSVIGTWATQDSTGGPATVTYDANNGATLKAEAPGGIQITCKGTYKLEKDALTVTITSVDLTSTDPVVQAQLNAKKAESTQQLLAAANQDPTEKIEWKGDDEFIGTGKDLKPNTYTRVKQ